MSNNDFTEIALTNDPRATVGELFVYGLLKRHLPDDCDIYIQPHVHSKQRADILILRKGYGAALLEIKDWIPEFYKSEIHEGKSIVKVASTGSILRHPADQIKAYKNSIYETCSLVGWPPFVRRGTLDCQLIEKLVSCVVDVSACGNDTLLLVKYSAGEV